MGGQLVRTFIDAINEHNVDKICSFLTDNHIFIDSQGNEMTGKEKMRKGWIAYFKLFPDYNIEVTDIFVKKNIIASFGFASGTFHGIRERKENFWRLPSSWKAIIKNDRIHVWQVYVDSKIPYDIISKANKD